MKKVGFIILRHVMDALTNSYWMLCYDNIRKYYPENLIMIIDDNSKTEFITDKELYKTTIINSEYHARGELLPYYYYLQNKLFDTAVILHDSAFICKYIDFSTIENYKIIWHFEHHWDQIEDETKNSIKGFLNLMENFRKSNNFDTSSSMHKKIVKKYII